MALKKLSTGYPQYFVERLNKGLIIKKWEQLHLLSAISNIDSHSLNPAYKKPFQYGDYKKE